MAHAEVREMAKAKQPVVGGQAADPCTQDVEALRMQHPVLGCFNTRRMIALFYTLRAEGHAED